MAKQQAPETVRLVAGEGDKAVTVSVTAEKADRLLVGGGYAKAPARKSAAKTAGDK